MTRVVLDDRVRRYDSGRVLVGAAGRILRLTDAGAAALDAPPPALARRLIDAGLAHPIPVRVEHPDATIVIPVRDRPAELDRCLAALMEGEEPAKGGGEDRAERGGEGRAEGGGEDRAEHGGEGRAQGVLVVDDGSTDAAAIAGVCVRRGARMLRRDVAGGPAAARNAAIARVDTELIAFLDSDCVAPPDWVRELAGHFDDPRVAAVAPRVRDPALDMGPSPASVAPGTRVSYVPSAALIVRRAALGGFDEALRYGEDVDLVWRLHDRGWRVRYDPRVTIEHDAKALLSRRFRYGTSAAPLSLRHPGRLAPFVLAPGPAAVLMLLAARKPKAAAAVLTAQTALLARRFRQYGVPVRLAPALTLRALVDTAKGITRGHPAYHAGVIAGALRYRTAAPLTPRVKIARDAPRPEITRTARRS
jgi:mycofactocin glycosyltransferase